MEEDSLPGCELDPRWDFPFTNEEVFSCIKVLQEICKDPEMLKKAELRDLRVSLDPICKQRLGIYSKLTETKVLRVPETTDKDLIKRTQLRKARQNYIDSLADSSRSLHVLDGPVISVPPIDINITLDQKQEIPLLQKSIKCYVCHLRFKQLHFFYDQLCPRCAKLNFEKRNSTADMTGRVCIVTGTRLKIGFQTALKLLRCGATVIGTTRFPCDAAIRFSKEEDFQIWKSQIHLFSLDFRHIDAIERFCHYIEENFDRLDVLINNACQTIQRPPAFYQELIRNEENLLYSSEFTKEFSDLLRHNHSFSELLSGQNLCFTASQYRENLFLSSNESTAGFPAGELDVHGQPIDLRTENSWVLKLHEVSSMEMAEVFLINSIAPAVLNAKLKLIMERRMDDLKFIVNVSAMEGKFYRNKTTRHPHTNMAKAALNMMTRTSAKDYSESNIFMTSVDTGWINDERPLEQAISAMIDLNFQPPLDEIDAASRILDPIFVPLQNLGRGEEANTFCGVFLKKLFPTQW